MFIKEKLYLSLNTNLATVQIQRVFFVSMGKKFSILNFSANSADPLDWRANKSQCSNNQTMGLKINALNHYLL